jgi:hypothetical protein
MVPFAVSIAVAALFDALQEAEIGLPRPIASAGQKAMLDAVLARIAAAGSQISATDSDTAKILPS